MEVDIRCPICKQEYRQQKFPRLLNCGHTFCQSCLDTLMSENEDGTFRITCSQDDLSYNLDNNDIAQFSKNITLFKIVESVRNVTSSFKDDSLQISKVKNNEDSRQDESERQLLEEIAGKGIKVLPELEKVQQKKEKQIKAEKVEKIEKVEKVIVEEVQLCYPHQKPLDLVCVNDMVRVCAKCAIFGQHKGHDLKTTDQIEEGWVNFTKKIENIQKEKHLLQSKIQEDYRPKEILSIYDQKKKVVQNNIRRYFKLLQDSINQAEESALAKLQQVSIVVQQKLITTINIDQRISEQYRVWEEGYLEAFIKSEGSNCEQKLFIMESFRKDKFADKGEAILQKIQNQQKNIYSQIENIVDSVNFTCNEQIYKLIPTFVTFVEVQKIMQKNQNNFEENLLDCQNEQKQENNFNHAYQERFQEKIQYQQPFKYVQTAKNSPRQQHKVQELIEKFERPNKKKLKSIKVPEKIQKVLQSLYLDTLDALDLTNAELGDATIVQICQFLRGSKVRSVKFIRNKLTDDVIPKIINSLGCIITLNLSQNGFTENAIEHLITYRNSMPSLKSVILSQNKIIERKHKNQIERLRKLDLTVSV